MSLAELDPQQTTEEETFSLPVSVIIPPELRPVENTLVKAMITVRPIPERRNNTFPVEVQAPPELLIVTTYPITQEVPLEVSAPANALREIADLRQEIQAYVRLPKDMPAGEARKQQ